MCKAFYSLKKVSIVIRSGIATQLVWADAIILLNHLNSRSSDNWLQGMDMSLLYPEE
jgi:hypothetical protein